MTAQSPTVPNSPATRSPETGSTASAGPSPLARGLMTAYGAVVYVVFLAVFVYAILFVQGLLVPKGIDDGVVVSPVTAVAVNLGLLGLFVVQHSVMARPAFKRWWTRLVPQPIERSTYVLFATAVLALLVWQWRPLPSVVWEVTVPAGRTVLYALSLLGWGLLALSTFLIDHFDMFGVRQVVRNQLGRGQDTPRFQTPLLYRLVRHPLYLGFLIVFWSAPTMSVGRLLFAAVITVYVLVAIRLEERDLVDQHGEDYRRYRERVPMLLPTGRKD